MAQETTVPDMHAAIVPAVSCAGIFIGTEVRGLLASARPTQSSGQRFGFHQFPSVKVWSIDGTIVQVGLSEGYQGLIAGRIGVGSTLADVEDWCACQIRVGKFNTLIAPGTSGLSFITDRYNDDRQIGISPLDRITSIFVHRPFSDT